jgi:hypothetical protein
VSADDADFAAGLSGSKFEALLDQSFYVNSEHGVVILDLVEVQAPQKPANPAPRQRRVTERFTITLVGPEHPVLPAAIYRVETRFAGETDIYLEPMVTGESTTRYRASFELLR